MYMLTKPVTVIQCQDTKQGKKLVQAA